MVKISTNSRRIRKMAAVNRNLFMHDELVAVVCKYFCRGMPVAEIKNEVQKKLGVVLSREEPYRLVAFAAQKGWLRYQAPLTSTLADQIKTRFPYLKEVKVVRTGVSDDVSYYVAAMLMEEAELFARLPEYSANCLESPEKIFPQRSCFMPWWRVSTCRIPQKTQTVSSHILREIHPFRFKPVS